MTSPIARLETRTLGVDRAGRRVVDAFDVQAQPGTWIAVVGPNGAGKSTLVSALAGALPAAAGEVLLDGCPLLQWPRRQRARCLAWLPQAVSIDAELRADEVVRLGRLPQLGRLGAAGPADEAAVQRALGDSDALGLAGRRLSELSGGERQRVLLARALATEAPLLLLDEPEAHLDPPHQRRLVELLRRLAGQGNTVVSVMHDLNLALAADRLWLMQGGQLMLDAATDNPALASAMALVFEGAVELLAHPARPCGPPLAVPAWPHQTRS